MASGSGVSSVPVEKLSGINDYHNWKFAMRMVLIHEDLWECVQSKEVKDEKKDLKALAKICLSVHSSVYSHVRNAKTAHEAWNNLEQAFQGKGLCRRLSLLRSLFSIKRNEHDCMDVYLSKVTEVVQQLDEIGSPLEDDFVAVIILSGLPSDYDPLIMTLENNNMKLSSELVKSRLLQEEQRRAGSSETVTAMVAKKTVVCYKCHKSGHVQKNCPQNVSKQQHKNKKAFQGKPTSKGMLTAMSVALNSNTWYVDSGATSHMTNNKDLYISFLPIEPVPVNVANGDKLSAIGVGKVKVNLKTGEKTISHVFYVPSLVGSLLSVSALTKKGFNVKFNKKGCIILSGRTVIATATHVNNVYQLDVCNNFTCNAATERVVPKVSVLDTLLTSQVIEVAQSDACSSDASQASLAADSEANAPSEKTSRETWHRRLAHLNARSMYIMKNGMVTGINYDEVSEFFEGAWDKA
ncbi:hypothetical protein K1T71_012043 [Dendrolimus kikuchii]|uniref:Uncharacterized protein n=1 Tax=Dendrolimus kikuchii TaxID=765133 RepID=A0ACC1CKE3_9NEOP|nr:hypothetical protein K1T71_012043 [Dendrolimus kikuchii]